MHVPALRSTLLLAGLFALAFASAPAQALCSTTRLIRSITHEGLSYVYTPGVDPETSESQSSVSRELKGTYWALGFGDPRPRWGIDNGGHSVWAGFDAETDVNADWSSTYVGYPLVINGHWAQSQEIDGCVDSAGPVGDICMAILLDDLDGNSSYFALLTRLSDRLNNFDFTQPGNAPITLAPLASPSIVEIGHTSARQLAVTVDSPSVDGGLYLDPACGDVADMVLGYRIYQWRSAPGDPPPATRVIEDGWFGTPEEGVCGEPLFVPLGDDVVVPVTCAEDSDVYLAQKLVFESGFESAWVSANSEALACRSCAAGTDIDGDGYCSSNAGTAVHDPIGGRRGVGPAGAPSDCDDRNPNVFPGAQQSCDGVNNDCLDSSWPAIPSDEVDHDGDGFSSCRASMVVELASDCDDETAMTRPGGLEICNGIDDDCDGLIDEGAVQIDADRDGIPGACDNCPRHWNPRQADSDTDGVGDACDPCTDRDADGYGDPGVDECPRGNVRDCADDDPASHVGAVEVFDGRDNDCDGVPDQGLDDDRDGIPNFRDRCPATPVGSRVDPNGCSG